MSSSIEKASPFTLKNQDEKEATLEDFYGHWFILYFYPQDDTPGCTTEACDFSQLRSTVEEMQIVGISPDSPESHKRFIDKYQLSIELLSDPDKEVMEAYGVWGLKKNYGREYEGVIRSTFLISPEGEIVYSWKNVKAKGHAQKVIKKLSDLSFQASFDKQQVKSTYLT